LESKIDKVMSTAIPGEVWRPTSSEQVLHLGLVEKLETNILISGKMIKEMPGSLASGKHGVF
jgi:hypothetical protein